MAKKIGFVMNKGGVGKTTIIAHLATVLGLHSKILIIDADAQGNASLAFGLDPNAIKKTIYDCMLKDVHPSDVIIKISPQIDFLPSNKAMNYFEIDVLGKVDNPLDLMKIMISYVVHDYDYIFIDSPPSLGIVAGNILKAVDSVIIPFVPEHFSVQGMIQIIKTINQAKSVEIEAVIANMVDKRTKMHRNLISQAHIFCDRNNIHMLDTVIPRRIEFAKNRLDPRDPIFTQIVEETKLWKKEIYSSKNNMV